MDLISALAKDVPMLAHVVRQKVVAALGVKDDTPFESDMVYLQNCEAEVHLRVSE